MEFYELYNKFLNDDSFQEEVEKISDDNSYNEFALKYEVPYSMEEIRNLIDDTVESTNSKCKSTYSKYTYDDLCIDVEKSRTQNKYNHPLLTTLGNRCCCSVVTCAYCPSAKMDGFFTYCKIRSKEYDECNGKK